MKYQIGSHYLLLLVSLAFLIPSCIFETPNSGNTTGPEPVRLYTDDTIAITRLDWPAITTDYPACSSTFKDYDTSAFHSSSGAISVIPSAFLQPVGTDEKLSVVAAESVRSSATRLTLETDKGVTVIDSGNLQSEAPEIILRFTTPGDHTIRITLPTPTDTLLGEVTIHAFNPQLPIVEMAISEKNLKTLQENPYEKMYAPAQITYKGFQYSGRVRLHGGSSRDYPKKSFRFDLSDGQELPDTHDHLIFRAEWNDKTMLRNYLCLELARKALWLPVPRAEMVHFRINKRYYGVMWHVERIGGDFLRIRGLNNTTSHLYEADPAESACFTPGGNLTPLATPDDYRCVYTVHKGPEDYADLIALIEETLLLPDDEFAQKANDIVRVNDMLAYFAFMAVIQNHDHIRKNYYLYRDPYSADDRWTIFPWDLELTLGHLWTETGDVLDETIFTDTPLDFGALTQPRNALFARLYNHPVYRQRFHEMVSHTLQSVFTQPLIDSYITCILEKAVPDILADPNKRADNHEYLSRVEEISEFVKDRRAFISTQLQQF